MRLPSPRRTCLAACALLGATLGASAQGADPVDPRVAAILARSRRGSTTSVVERGNAAQRFWNAAPAAGHSSAPAAAAASFGRPDPSLTGAFGAPATGQARRARRAAFFGSADRGTIFAPTSPRMLFGTAARTTIYSPADPAANPSGGDAWDDDFIGARHLAARSPVSGRYARRYR